ncbi:Aegerolysin-domain-containing protein [Nemania sp. NC0429]|nr:Aegerolysin-domain-containing protein [Nemania sp. NC0429]
MATIQGYDQWVEIASFYERGNQYIELSRDQINKLVIDAGERVWVCACGRSGSPSDSGTTGTVEVYDDDDDDDDSNTYICRILWNCPLTGDNSFSTQYANPYAGYIVASGRLLSQGGLSARSRSRLRRRDRLGLSLGRVKGVLDTLES